MKLSELIEIEKVMRELIYCDVFHADDKFFETRNRGAKSLGILVFEINEAIKKIKVEIKDE